MTQFPQPAPGKTYSTGYTARSVYRARLKRQTEQGWYLTIPRLTGDSVIGPFTSTVSDLQAEDRVIVVAIEDNLADLVIIGKIL